MRHNRHMSDRHVTASELKNFTFCQRAWFLARQGAESALVGERARGRADHQRPRCSTVKSRTARGNAPVRARAGRNSGRSHLLDRPMIWNILGASAAILVLAFFLRFYSQKRLAVLDLAGEVIYWDASVADEVFVSHKHGLTGKPDYIRKEGDQLIPVELKSRSVSAAGPYYGEVLQLAAYCLW